MGNKIMEYLNEEFRIGSVEELEDEVEKMDDIDISLFVTPFQRVERTTA